MIILLLMINCFIAKLDIEYDTRDFDGNMQRGIRLYLEKDWKASADFFKVALMNRPENPIALYFAACAHANQKNSQESSYYLFLLSKQDNTQSRQILYSVYWDYAFDGIRKTNYFRKAISNINSIYTNQKPDPSALKESNSYFLQGMNSLSHYEYDEAITYFRFSISYWVYNEAPYYYSAVCYARQGFPDRAVTELQKLYVLKTGLSYRFLAMLPKDPNFNEIRDNIKFKQFIHALPFD
ncbi:MAG: hypothetical protein JXA60_12410 [Candidatus Coatesbacteria bacterium]|nr:hypothetical protein [Candidatus Coatesbacteria bacterium]